jgi:hypothetical protein
VTVYLLRAFFATYYGGRLLGITVTVGTTVTVYAMVAFGVFSLDILDPDAAPFPQAVARLFDAHRERGSFSSG